MAASTLLRKTVSSEDWVTATKETRRQKKLFPAIKHSDLQEKNVFRNNYFGSVFSLFH